MIRTQIYLDEEVLARVLRLAGRQGRTVSDLVRDALVRVYGTGATERQIGTLRAIEGLWRNRDDLGPTEEHVRRSRRDTRRGRRS